MGISLFAPNILLSEFALKLRQYRIENHLELYEVAARLGIKEERIFALEIDNAKPTFLERWRLKKLMK